MLYPAGKKVTGKKENKERGEYIYINKGQNKDGPRIDFVHICKREHHLFANKI